MKGIQGALDREEGPLQGNQAFINWWRSR